MEEKLRTSGIEILGNVPWGTHFCQFYRTREDLLDILIPYFKAGMENNEFCMWVTSEPLSVEIVKKRMRAALPAFESYLRKGQIEIIPHTDWYLKGGAFNQDRVLNGWVEKLNHALEKGYNGLRLTGNTFWLEQKDWEDFTAYEEAVNNVIGAYKMLAVCTYSLDKCRASEVIDVVRNHQFALIKQEGAWKLIESSERKRAEEALRESEEQYRRIIETANEGIILAGPDGRMNLVNRKMADMLGYPMEELIGRVGLDFMPEDQKEKVLENRKKLAKHEQIQGEFCFRCKDGTLLWTIGSTTPIFNDKGEHNGNLAMHTDITERKRADEALRKSNQRLDLLSETASRLLASDRPQELVNELCEKVKSYLDCHAFFNFLVDEKAGRLRLNAYAGIPEETAKEIEWLDYGVAVCGCAARDGERIVCENIPETPDPRTELVKSYGIKAYACHPLFSRGKVIGTLSFGTRSRRSFSEDDLALMKTVADQVAVAMERVKAHEELELRVQERTAELKRIVEILHGEIRERVEAEDRTKLTNALLRFYTEKSTKKEYLDAAVDLIRAWSGCGHIGVRVADNDGNIPYESCVGFSSEFLDSENMLSLKRDQCACTRVVAGTPEPQDKPAMTPNGSFYSNNTMKFVEGLTDEQKMRFRGVCIRSGFTSVAVIPIRYRDRVLGAIHLADEREGLVPLKNVEFLEQLAFIIGEAIHRFNVEEELRKNFGALKASSDLLENMFTSLHVMIAYMDRDFNFIRVNRAYAEADGKEPEFFAGKNHFALFPYGENEKIFRRVVETGEPYFAFERAFEYAEHPERGVSYWDWSLVPVKEADGGVSGAVLSLIDVTERKRAEERAALFRNLVNQSSDAVFVVDPETSRVLEVNDAACGMLSRYGREELLAMNVTDFAERQPDPSRWKEHVAEVREKGVVLLEDRLRRNDGSVLPVEVSVTIVPHEKKDYLVAAVRDITERKRTEEELRKINRALRILSRSNEALVYANEELAFIQDICRIVVEAGDFRMAWIGYAEPDGERRVRPVAHAGHEDGYLSAVKITWNDDEWGRGPTGTAIRTGEVRVQNHMLTDPNYRPWKDEATKRGYASSIALPLTWKGKTFGALTIYASARDIFIEEENKLLKELADDVAYGITTLRLREEQKYAEAERARLISAVESTAEAVVITDAKGMIRYINPAFEQITGYTKDEAIGRDLHILDSGKHDEEFYRKMRETMRRDGVWQGRLINKKKDGTFYYEDCTYSPVRNPSGEIINYVSVKRDVTEKIRLESIAESVNTLDNIGYVFSGVRHEIGNPINTIKMILSVLQHKLDKADRESIRDYLNRSLTEIGRVEDLLKSLKNFNMFETVELGNVSMQSFMEKFLKLVAEDFEKRGVAVTADIRPEAEWGYADPRALQQALLNIMTNAADALEGREKPAINITVMKSDRRVLIRIADNGAGMTEKQQQDIFKPFYTSKLRGTGLGLVIVKKMLTKMHGDIAITSRLNEGTTVDIFIPEGGNGS